MPSPRPVVVGVSTEPGNDLAVRWAAAEADRFGRPLILLHVTEVDDEPGTLLESARAVAGAELAASLIYHESVEGRPELVLTAESDYASTIVLGSRPRTPPNGVLLGSVCDRVASTAHCPVVVVRPVVTDPGVDGPIIAAVDGTDLSDNVLSFAFEHASSNQVPLIVTMAWRSHGGPSGLEGPRTRATDLLSGLVDGWRKKYPDVVVRLHVVEGSPVSVLLDRTAGARLLVLGTHSTDDPNRSFGSVSYAVLQHSSCPVAVVHTADR